MRIALKIEVQSPEADLLQKFFGRHGDVDVLKPWDVRNVSVLYDLAVCVGPVEVCPVAKKRMAFVLGPSCMHNLHDADVAIVTSKRAYSTAIKNHRLRTFLCSPPLLEMQVGWRRLCEHKHVLIHDVHNPGFSGESLRMRWWGLPGDSEISFSPMEFNSLCRNGAWGMYGKGHGLPTDGYDIQVRRHLAFGSPVVCPQDKEVLGDLADVCLEEWTENVHIGSISDPIREVDYLEQLDEIVRRI